MRKTLLAASLLFVSSFTIAQQNDTDAACHEKCSHAHHTQRSVNGVNQIAYYQSPQLDRYDVKYMKLDLEVAPANTFVSGTCTYMVRAVQPLDTLAMEFRDNMTLDSVYVNGTKRTFTRSADHVYVAFSPQVAGGTTLNIIYYYRGNVSTALGAIFTGTSASTGLTYAATLSECFQAREWYPAKQILTDKTDSIDMWFTCGDQYMVGSNGALKQVVTLPGAKKQFRWSHRSPVAYYQPAFAVGNYMEYINYAKPTQLVNDSVKVQHFIVNSTTYFNSVKQGLDNTTQFIEKFSQLFGLYPFYKEKYGHMQASIGGGMEHQTMSTMASFGNNLIVHELAHQWFGNSTTCATWNHIWINEGFATYSEYLAQEQLPALYSAGAAASYMNSIHNSVMSSTGGSVHVPNASVYDENRIFSSRLSYNKGAAICHTLRFEMQNDNLYFQGLRTFLTRYKDSTATADQLKAVMEETAGRSLNDFFNQWYYGEGYPTYNVDYTKQGNNLVLTVTHTGSSAVTPLFKGLLEMRVQSAQGDTTLKLNITANNQQFTIPYTKTPSGVVVDPNNWIVNKVGLITTPVNNITEDATLKIFPNPASDIAYLSFKAGRYQQLQVFSAAGQLLAQRSIGNNLTQLTLPLAYAPGLYFIKLTGKENATVRKVEVR